MGANDFGLSKTILIVDDDEDLREVLEYDLKMKGFTVTALANGLDALEHVKKQEINIDIIISDIQMPKLDGIEFLKEAQGFLKSTTAFFFMTGFSKYAQEELIELGAHGLIEKPINRNKLFLKIQEALAIES